MGTAHNFIKWIKYPKGKYKNEDGMNLDKIPLKTYNYNNPKNQITDWNDRNDI